MSNYLEDVSKLKEEIIKIKADHAEELLRIKAEYNEQLSRVAASYEARISNLKAAQDNVDFDLTTPLPEKDYNWLENPIVQGLAAGLIINHITNNKK